MKKVSVKYLFISLMLIISVSFDRRVTIPCSGRSLGIQLADYNRDGWLDIAVNSYKESVVNRIQGKVNYVAQVPYGTQLLIEIRSSSSKIGIDGEKWIRTDDSDYFKLKTEDRFLQYKAVFISDNGDRFPVLDRVVIELNK